MKAIMLMFDSLNRNYLPAYGCAWTKLSNFNRLAQKSVVFDYFYAGSLPCMPARRDLHTGKQNFLHSDWSCLQPQDFSIIEEMGRKDIYTHMVTDHFHYWEDGGHSYLQRYHSFEMVRGQQGDPWIGQVTDPHIPKNDSKRKNNPRWRQDWVNRAYLDAEEKMPQYLTVEKGIKFIKESYDKDNWFLQIECFDPHEPFFTQASYKALYRHDYSGLHYDWPDYGQIQEEDKMKHIGFEYAALLNMCDHYLGKVLDLMDKYNLWQDTMLIVNTDHGFLLGEHGYIGKNIMPLYEEISHLPFFLYDPRNKKQGVRCKSLAQTVDIPATLAKYFNLGEVPYGEGFDLREMVEAGVEFREYAIFGVFGRMVNITDKRYVYMKAPAKKENAPLYQYTLVPNHMNWRFTKEELVHAQLTKEFIFTQGIPLLKIPAQVEIGSCLQADLLFDLKQDPRQETPIEADEVKKRMEKNLSNIMAERQAPKEQWIRLGLR